jgi:predicted ATPase/DNA-binding SARP family transcriptional activator
MARLSIFLLGSFRVVLDGEPVTGFVSDKARALLAFLAVEAERPHRREVLAGLLWPEYPERSARASLRNVLANVRQVIGDQEAHPPFLCVAGQTIQFNPEADAQVDVTAFIEGLELAGDSPQSHAETIHELEAAVALYQGGFLEGFSLPDSFAFEEWALLKREQLQRRALAALGRLADHYEGRGEYERALRFAWWRVEADPYRGVAQRGLMRLLALSGQREAALAQYEAFRRLLAEEMGVAPAEETVRLYEQIQAGELTPPAPDAPKHNLPVQVTPFVGRETELAELARLLADPDVRLLTILGAGGMGKTRLALEASAAQLDNFERGVFFVSLAPLRSVDAIVPTVASAIGFSFYGGGEPRQQLLDYLCQKNMLLIMDNFEHLLDDVDLASDVLKTAPDVKILATSRARLNVRGEHRFQIVGIECPDWETLENAADPTDRAEHSAVKLFLQGARRARPGFKLEADDFKYVSRICRLVQGMPLGILLAAAWVEMLTLEEIAAEIGQSLDFLETDLRDVPERQRSIRAVFDHSFNLLAEREREVFQALSVFRGGFTREAAQQVTGASLRELMALANKSLLHRTSTGRYQMHELTRQYAAEKLELSPAANQAARKRHSVYYTAALQRWGTDLKGPRQKTALAEMDVEIENARSAWDWAAEWGQVERLDQALEGLCEFYRAHWRLYEGEAACRTAAQKLIAMASGDGPVLPVPSAAEGSTAEGLRVLARILTRQAGFGRKWECTEPINQLLHQSLAILEGSELAGYDTRAEKAFVLLQMGITARYSDPDYSRRMYEQSLALYRAVGDRWWTAILLEHSSTIMTEAFGAYDKAKQLAKESLAIGRALGNPTRVAGSLTILSWSALFLGQIEEAERLLRESIPIYREIGVRGDELIGVAWGLLWLGNFNEAHSLYKESLAIFSDLGNRWCIPFLNAWLGYAKAHLGQYEQARVQVQIALAISRELDDQLLIGCICFMLGSVALAEQAYAEAWQLLEEGVAVSREIKNRETLDYGLAVLGYAPRGLGQLPQAERYFYETLRTSAEIRSLLPLLLVLPGIALLLADRGEKERAVELYALASRYPLVANSRWFEDVAGKHIAAVAATLPPDVVAAAQERGRAREMDATVAELLAELE